MQLSCVLQNFIEKNIRVRAVIICYLIFYREIICKAIIIYNAELMKKIKTQKLIKYQLPNS